MLTETLEISLKKIHGQKNKPDNSGKNTVLFLLE